MVFTDLTDPNGAKKCKHTNQRATVTGMQWWDFFIPPVVGVDLCATDMERDNNSSTKKSQVMEEDAPKDVIDRKTLVVGYFLGTCEKSAQYEPSAQMWQICCKDACK